MVFTTKDRIPFLNSQEIRSQIFEHITNNAKKKNIWLDIINGHKQQIHCLISLGKEQNISNIAQLIKGESSFWINQNRIVPGKFNWQDDFWAVSVSESHVDAVRNYISNQEEHHRNKSFDEEVEEFMKKYGWNFIDVKSK
jgi:putative transposase